MGGYLGNVGAMIAQALLGLVLTVTVLRVVLPLSGARFRNPICQLIYKITNPLLAPLTRVIANWRNISVAGVLLAWLCAVLGAGLVVLLLGTVLTPLGWLLLGTCELVYFTLRLYFWIILIYALMSFVSPDRGNPLVELLTTLARPVLRPFDRLPPRLEGVSLSPLWASLAIQIVIYTLTYIGLPGLHILG